MFKKHVRKIIYAINLGLALIIFVTFLGNNTKLNQAFALLSLSYLYITLLISPIYSAFPNLPEKPLLIRARRALGISAFFFASLHGFIGFFIQLQGFYGLEFLSEKYIQSIILGLTSLSILLIMTITSFEFFVRRLGKKWKMIHRLVYVAAVLIVFHALILGSHYMDLRSDVALISLFLIVLLLVLELFRFNKFLEKRWPQIPHLNIVSIGIGLFLIATILPVYIKDEPLGFTVHNTHEPTQSGQPGELVSEKFDARINVDSNKIVITAYNTRSGDLVQNYQRSHGAISHLIIVTEDFTEFHHLHPLLKESTFSTEFNFDLGKSYRIYFSYQPSNWEEQVSAISYGKPTEETNNWNKELSTNVEEYKVSIDQNSLNDFRKNNSLKFTIENTKTNEKVDYVEPYLDSLAHLTLINSKSFEKIHAHAKDMRAFERGGPEIEVIVTDTSLREGPYTAYLEFSIKNKTYIAKLNFEL